MALPKEITKLLKKVDRDLASFVIGLEKENLRLHSKIVKLQIDVATKSNEIKALKKTPPVKITVKKFS